MNSQSTEVGTLVEDTDSDVPLSFDAWANLSAKLLGRDRDARLDILAAHDIEVEAWDECDQHWSNHLAAELVAGRTEQARRYGVQCAEELKRRKTEAFAAGASPVASGGTHENLTSTAPAMEMPLPAGSGSPLPFGSSPSPEFLAKLAAPHSTPSHDPTGGLTAPLGTDLMSQLKSTLPFAKQRAAPTPAEVSWPRLTLQQYASLCAELSVTPQIQMEILHKYHILTEADRKAVDREWKERLAAHTDTQKEWQRLYSEYREWLLRRPG